MMGAMDRTNTGGRPMPRMFLAKAISRAALLGGAALVAGCTYNSSKGSLGDQLGFSVPPPDEFMVIARAPLEMPPDFSLPTPQPGAPSPRMPNPNADARASLFGSSAAQQQAGGAGVGEQALLAGAGAQNADPSIRGQLEAEQEGEGGRRFGLTSLFGIPVPANIDEPESTLQSQEENERLRREGLQTPASPPIEEEPPSGVLARGRY
ncbi:MAG: DUF3035 domain-containing protein [Pikeienuella sp.]